MEKSQKKSVIPLIITVMILLIISGIFYFTKSKNTLDTQLNNQTAIISQIKEPIKGKLMPSRYDDKSIVFVYSKDAHRVYFKDKEILNVDSETFIPIENGEYIHSYAKDKNSVYYEGTKIIGADPLSFEILWSQPPEGCRYSTYSKDKNNVYYKNILVPGADVKTFTPLIFGPVKGSIDRSYGEFGKDKNQVFKEENVLKGIKVLDFTTECQYG